jgi:hypothetical protein
MSYYFRVHAQSAKTDKRTDELSLNEQVWGSLMLTPKYEA